MLIRPLAWELPYAAGAALKRQKKCAYEIRQEGNIPKYTSDYAGCGRLTDIFPLFSIFSKFLKSSSVTL